MQTDYQNLKSFDIATIVVMAIGVVIIGFVAYTTLPAEKQSFVADAVAILDMQDKMDAPIESVSFAFETTEKFLDEFYIAFAQVAVLPESVWEIPADWENTYLAILNYSDQVAFDYQRLNTTGIALASERGAVAGLSIDIDSDEPVQLSIGGCGGEVSGETTELEMPYAFKPLEKDFWKERIYLPLVYKN